jgi:hypothetical protein
MQISLIAHFSAGPDEDVSATALWSPIGDLGVGELSQTGYFTPRGTRLGYQYVTGSMGFGVDVPRSGIIGVWEACP